MRMMVSNGIKSSDKVEENKGAGLTTINCRAVSVVVSFLWYNQKTDWNISKRLFFSQHLSAYDWVYMTLVIGYTTV